MKISAVNPSSPPSALEQKTAAAEKAAGANYSATSTDTQQKEVVQAVEKLNKDAEATNRQVRFALHDDTHRILIEVVDKDTKQVVATFPPKQILDMMASFAKDAKEEKASAAGKVTKRSQEVK